MKSKKKIAPPNTPYMSLEACAVIAAGPEIRPRRAYERAKDRIKRGKWYPSLRIGRDWLCTMNDVERLREVFANDLRVTERA